MTDYADWVFVVPAPDAIRDTARLLLDIAQDPTEIRTQGNGTEFIVPSYVADEYHARLSGPRPTKRRGKHAAVSPKE